MNQDLERYNILKFVITKYEITGNLESEWGTYDEIIQELGYLKSKLESQLEDGEKYRIQKQIDDDLDAFDRRDK